MNMKLWVGPNDDQTKVVVELWMNGKPLGHIYLDGDAAEQHAHGVITARMQLSDWEQRKRH